MASYSDPGKN